MSLIKLCFVFFYIGLFTIGGGQVAITLMQQELMEKGLVTPERFANMIAISESTPGPIGINMATYIGCELYGIPGGILATLFTILPSLICIIVVAKFLQKVQDNPYVKSAFSTIKPVVTGLIAVACWNVMEIALVKPGNIDWVSIIFFFISLALLTIKKMHPIAIVLLGAFFGIVFL